VKIGRDQTCKFSLMDDSLVIDNEETVKKKYKKENASTLNYSIGVSFGPGRLGNQVNRFRFHIC